MFCKGSVTKVTNRLFLFMKMVEEKKQMSSILYHLKELDDREVRFRVSICVQSQVLLVFQA